MEGYVSRSDWYLTDTEHPPPYSWAYKFFHETYIQHVSRSDQN